MINWDTPEDAFAELDKLKLKEQQQESQQTYDGLAQTLGDYRQCLINQGFSRREALRFVRDHAKFLYDLSLQDKMSKEANDRIGRWIDSGDDDVDE